MLIIAENQLRKGDIVRIKGRAGLVEDLNLRRILIRDLDGALHIIPNGSTDIITNLTSQWSRVNIEINVSYEEDLEKAIKTLNNIGDKVDNDAKSKVEELRINLKEATEKDDYETMKSLIEELQKELYALGASVYQQAGAANQAAQGTETSTNNNDGDDVIDAEFTETK